VRSSWRSSVLLGLASTTIVGTSPEISAHRRDEYLQAARIEIDLERAHIELDLTAGIAVADLVIAEIDRDRTGTISDEEAEAYAAVVRRAIRLEVDGTPLALQLVDRRFPTIEAVKNGEGAIRIDLAAQMPPLSAGSHHLLYRNSHRVDIGVYLANVLVPVSDLVAVSAQRRDVDQRELIVDYVLRAPPSTAARGRLLAGVASVLFTLAVLWWRWSRAR
jgi:hypothetical protein